MPIIRFDGWKTPGKEPGTLTHRLTTYVVGAEAITSGISHFEPGASVPLHYHNCEEQVTVVQGSATAVIEGVEQAVAELGTEGFIDELEAIDVRRHQNDRNGNVAEPKLPQQVEALVALPLPAAHPVGQYHHLRARRRAHVGGSDDGCGAAADPRCSG